MGEPAETAVRADKWAWLNSEARLELPSVKSQSATDRRRGETRMNHKRKGPKSTRNGCLLCKPHKRQGYRRKVKVKGLPERMEIRGMLGPRDFKDDV
jgi:hypothetical protein